MSIKGLHIPCGNSPVSAVTVNERNAMSYYPYVHGGPVEAGHLNFDGLQLAVYVNSRYAQLSADEVNDRATALFEIAGVGMFGGAIRGDVMVVCAAGDREYEQSLPSELIEMFIQADSGL